LNVPMPKREKSWRRTDFRYATPSPAVCPACERSKPFFLRTKLDPMRTPLTMARMMPTIWVAMTTEWLTVKWLTKKHC
jgi:hypothetical protein